MANKTEKELAYEAGKAAITEPPERRSLDACPFAVGTDERSEWVRGLTEAVEAQTDISALHAALKAEQKNA